MIEREWFLESVCATSLATDCRTGLWRRHSCRPRQDSEFLKSSPRLWAAGENDLSHSPACTIAGQAKACPTTEESQPAWVGHALACPATFGLTTNSTTSGVPRLRSEEHT